MTEGSQLKVMSKVADILELFRQEEDELGITEISRKLDISKSTVHRIVSSLHSIGLLCRAADSQKYMLGFKLLELAEVLTRQLDVHKVALPYMRALRDQTNETVALHLLRGRSRVCVAQVEGHHQLRRVYEEVGIGLPLYLGAAGKAIMAYLPPVEVEAIFLEARTGTTFDGKSVDTSSLQKQLELVKKQGYAVTSAERTSGITSVASTIFKAGNTVAGSINVSGPSSRFSRSKIDSYVQQVMEVASLISRDLGSASGISLVVDLG
ncbi:MAG: IclR family transcriptional regulator [bacterium]|jgi:DNA-binding IclR family transcriptional regulator